MVSVLCKGSPRQRLLAQRADYTCNTVVVEKAGARKWGDCSTPGRGARRQTYEEVEDPGPRTLHRRGQEQKGWRSLYTHNRKGIEICRLYGEGKCGTKAPQVQEGCDLCLGPHMSSECPGCWQLTRRAGWFRWATSHAGPPHTPHQRGSDASSSKKPRTPSPTASVQMASAKTSAPKKKKTGGSASGAGSQDPGQFASLPEVWLHTGAAHLPRTSRSNPYDPLFGHGEKRSTPTTRDSGMASLLCGHRAAQAHQLAGRRSMGRAGEGPR